MTGTRATLRRLQAGRDELLLLPAVGWDSWPNRLDAGPCWWIWIVVSSQLLMLRHGADAEQSVMLCWRVEGNSNARMSCHGEVPGSHRCPSLRPVACLLSVVAGALVPRTAAPVLPRCSEAGGGSASPSPGSLSSFRPDSDTFVLCLPPMRKILLL